MTRREIILLMAICVIPFVFGGILVVAQEAKITPKIETKTLPKTVGLTELQRLKDENLQLKLGVLKQQMDQINSERAQLLKAAMNAVGIDDRDIGKYEYNQANYVFFLKPEPTKTPAKK